MPRLRVSVLILILGVTVFLRAAAWMPYNHRGLTIYVRPGQEALAARIGVLVDAHLPRIADAVGLTTVRVFPLYAYHSHVEFMRDAGLDLGLRGLSFSSDGTIYLDADDAPVHVEQTLAHELTHSLLAQRLGPGTGGLPTWVNEGIAGHLSDPVTPNELEGVSRLIHRDGVLSLDEMNRAFPSGAHRDAAYLQSRSMIAWLAYHHPDAIRRLLDRLAAGDAFSTALSAAAGLSPEQWWRRWQEAIPPIIFWISILSSPVLYTPLVLLIVWITIQRARKKAEEARLEAEAQAAEEAEDDENED